MNRTWLVLALTLSFLLTGIAWADITIKSTIENTGLGGIANMQGTQQLMISGDKSKTVSNLKMTNKVVKFFGGGKPTETTEITRLDKELIWAVNTKDKSYTEITFAQMKALLESAKAKAAEEKGKSDSTRLISDITVTPTGKTQMIAGFKASEVIIHMTFVGKDSSSGKTGKMIFDSDLWMAKDVPGYAEYQAYHKTMAEKMGLTGQGQEDVNRQLAAFGVDSKAMYEKMKDIEGMPLMTTISILPEGLDTIMARANDSLQAAQKREAEADATKDSSAEKSEPTSIQNTDDVKKSAMKKLGGLFGKKKDKNKEADDRSKQPPTDQKPYLFHVTTTVTEISQESISASEFEIPEGYKLKKD
ncbi:MAG: hypothetical protein WAU88_06425 [Candidatus Zixiibacteriota bacterium]